MTHLATGAKRRNLIFDLLMIYVLLVGAYFRLVGIDWGEYQYLHPDERFLVWVGTDISPVGTPDERLGQPPAADAASHWAWRASYSEVFRDCQEWGGYFDSACSPLNPPNRGHAFYVYGTLPLFIARYAVEWIYGHSGFNEMTDVGRALSAAVDLLAVLLVYLIAKRLYDRRVGLLAAAFSAAVVLQIQQAHFFTVDSFLNFFTYLAIYFAVRVAMQNWPERAEPAPPDPPTDREAGAPPPEPTNRPSWLAEFIQRPYFTLSILFGVALGCAVSSKLNAAPVAIMLPGAFALTMLPLNGEQRGRRALDALAYLSLAAVVSILVFRIFQPYAFSGPGFFGFKPNPQWVANIREQRIQAAGDVDFPPAMQWARRPLWFSGTNLVLWGLGLPLGLLSWSGFLWIGWRMLGDRTRGKSALRSHALLWGWVAFYFVWQSLAFNPTMRYQLPIYPSLTIFAGWAVVALYDRGRAALGSRTLGGFLRSRGVQALSWLLGALVLALTLAWAFAFTRIYVRPITRVAASQWIYQNVPGPVNLHIQGGEEVHNQPLPVGADTLIVPEQPYLTVFAPKTSGLLSEIYLAHVLDTQANPAPKTLKLSISRTGEEVNSSAIVVSSFLSSDNPSGDGYLLNLDQPLALEENQQYHVTLSLESGFGALALSGAAPANETSWDDGLPLRIDGYDGYGGIYQPGLNFEMYWDDTAEKLERMTGILDQADYLFISSSRQWGSLPRIPERFPLTAEYYRQLIGCPPERQVEWCYNVAQPGTFQGQLGFELVKVFQSNPSIGPFEINDQASEEAFTVYDHPKVFIFRKSAAYDAGRTRQILGAVDLSQVVHVTPKRAGAQPANLMLPPARWAQQQQGGTWSQLFDTKSLLNRYPAISVLAWYLSLAMLGVVIYPLVRLALKSLPDRGYPLARIVGLLLLAYLVWLAGSFEIPFYRVTIGVALGLLALLSLVAAWYQRAELREEWRTQRGYFLAVEALFLGFFVLDLLIRLGNPDLWHPWKGGEKPMDFSYFNAVLKSTTFPPYDPWYAGGYLNYYYYGFVLVGAWVKLWGFVPSIAYNLILPTIFACIALGAFSLSWNLAKASQKSFSPWLVGIAGALGMALLGNLGTVRMIYQGYQRLAAPGGVIEGAGVFTRMVWSLRGAIQALTGASLPYGIGDWYWIPSRAIPAPGDVEPITEFPFFTVLYGDPHAHLFALPVSLVALSVALALVLGRTRWQHMIEMVATFLLGGLAIGALKPTNTWDFYPYLALGIAAVGYAFLRYYQPGDRGLPYWRQLPLISQRILASLLGAGVLVGLSILLYQPYSAWYGLGYGKVDIWHGTHTSVSAYLTHWGLFLFLIISWMAWETREWLATTPVSALRKLEPYKLLLQTLVVLLLAAVVALLYMKIRVAWLVLPLAFWCGVLLFRPGISETKRFVLFLVGSGLVLTLTVEAIVLRGDIGRMNTVFKFYLQVWTLFAVSAAAALGWLSGELARWEARWRSAWQLVLFALVFGAALFPLLGGTAKIKDRIAEGAPHTLDGMAFMQHAQYGESWGVMNLAPDYRAIRWMQENVVGSPVIVEANQRDLYRWSSRYSIYTGLPGVVGWEWHQQQQRALLPPNWVSDRIAEIDAFYLTTDWSAARDFLHKYDVRYVVVGQLERGLYAGEGLDKFSAAEGLLWRAVYQEGETMIYEVVN